MRAAPSELLARLLEVVEIEVGVAERVDEVARPEPRHLGNHVRQQRIGGDVERQAEEEVGRPLVQLTREPVAGDVELEERMARGERHTRQVGDVPRADDVPARIGIVADAGDHGLELVDRPSVRRGPRAPLDTVDRAEIAVRVGPLVPDRDPVLLQPADVRVAADEPQELADHRPHVHLLRGHQREAVLEIEPQLVPEDAQRPGAGPVVLAGALVEHALQEVEVLLHVTDATNRPGSRCPGSP